MGSFPKTIAVLLCMSLGAAAVAAKKDGKPPQESKKKEEKKPARDSKKQEQPPGDSARKEMIPIPKGHDSKGLKIPYNDPKTGKLQMIFTIGVASRIDDNHVRMADLQIETFDPAGRSEMKIDLPTSVIDLNTRVISTDKQVRIQRDDFELTGESMEFNTETKQGSLTGGVRMLIYNLADEAPKREGRSRE